MRWGLIAVLLAAAALAALAPECRSSDVPPVETGDRSTRPEAEPPRLEGREDEREGPSERDAAAVEGTVLRVRGTVRLRGRGDAATDGMLHFRAKEGPSGRVAIRSDGTFLGDLPAGRVPDDVIARPGSSGTFLDTWIQLTGLDLSEPLALEVHPSVVIQGRVVEAGTGRGIGGALLSRVRPGTDLPGIRGPRPESSATERVAGEDGRFRWTGIRPPAPGEPLRIDLVARRAGWRTTLVAVSVPAGRAEVDGIEIALARGVALRGRVTRTDGGAPAAWVSVVAPERHALGWAERIRILGQGPIAGDGFALEGLEPISGAEIHVSPAGGDESELGLSGVDATTDRDDLIVTLPPRHAVAVRRLHPPGVSGANRPFVVLTRTADGPWRNVRSVRVDGTRPFAIRVFAGRVSMERPDLLFRGETEVETARGVPPPDEVAVTLHETSAPSLPFPWWDVDGDPTPGDPAALLLLTFLDDATGAPLSSSTVTVAERRTGRTCRLDADGRYVLPTALGEHWITFVVAGYASETVRLAPGEPSLVEGTVRLRRLPP